MKYASFLSVALLVGVAGVAIGSGPARAQQGLDLVKQAVAAQGGAEALRGLKAVTIKAKGRHWEPGPVLCAGRRAALSRRREYLGHLGSRQGRRARNVWDRAMKYPAVEQLKYTEVVMPDQGTVVTDPRARSRCQASASPRRCASSTVLRRCCCCGALDAPQSVAALPDQNLGEIAFPAVSITQRGTKFIVLFDRMTHLPVAIRTRDDDNVYGDSNYDMVMDDWRDVGGVKIAHARSYQVNGIAGSKARL